LPTVLDFPPAICQDLRAARATVSLIEANPTFGEIHFPHDCPPHFDLNLSPRRTRVRFYGVETCNGIEVERRGKNKK
jgi:hypothetical protein